MEIMNMNQPGAPFFEAPDQNRERKIERGEFRVSFFGTGSSKSPDDQRAMELAEKLAGEVVAEGGHKIVTGGYDSGVMGAASKGAYEKAKELGKDDLIPDGVTFGEAFGKPSEMANTVEVPGLLTRLKELINKSEALVVFHGKTGTLVEMITAIWQEAGDAMVNGEKHTAKPTIIVDSSLEHTDTLSLLNKRDGKFKYAMDAVYVVSATEASNIDGIVKKVNEIIEIYFNKINGIELTADQKELLQKQSLKKFLADMEQFSGGGGI